MQFILRNPFDFNTHWEKNELQTLILQHDLNELNP